MSLGVGVAAEAGLGHVDADFPRSLAHASRLSSFLLVEIDWECSRGVLSDSNYQTGIISGDFQGLATESENIVLRHLFGSGWLSAVQLGDVKLKLPSTTLKAKWGQVARDQDLTQDKCWQQAQDICDRWLRLLYNFNAWPGINEDMQTKVACQKGHADYYYDLGTQGSARVCLGQGQPWPWQLLEVRLAPTPKGEGAGVVAGNMVRLVLVFSHTYRSWSWCRTKQCSACLSLVSPG
eukprot:1383356-Amphidinium_carterae.2